MFLIALDKVGERKDGIRDSNSQAKCHISNPKVSAALREILICRSFWVHVTGTEPRLIRPTAAAVLQSRLISRDLRVCY